MIDPPDQNINNTFNFTSGSLLNDFASFKMSSEDDRPSSGDTGIDRSVADLKLQDGV